MAARILCFLGLLTGLPVGGAGLPASWPTGLPVGVAALWLTGLPVGQGVKGPNVVVDPFHEDVDIEVLKRRSATFNGVTAPFSEWSETLTMPKDFGRVVWDIPQSVMNNLPRHLKALMPEPPIRVLRNLDVVELFAGSARLTEAARHAGLHAVAVDRQYGKHMDLLTDEGWMVFTFAVLRLRPGGLLWLAPQCSTWVWPGGKEMNRRVAFLCLLAGLLGVQWIIEQPLSSLWFGAPSMKNCLTAGAKKVLTWLKGFGHPMAKPTILWGTPAWIKSLARLKNAGAEAALPAESAGGNEAGLPAVHRRRHRSGHDARAEKSGAAKAEKARKSHTKVKVYEKPSMSHAKCVVKAKATAKTMKPERATKPSASHAGYHYHGEDLTKITGDRDDLHRSQVYPVRFAKEVVRLFMIEYILIRPLDP